MSHQTFKTVLQEEKRQGFWKMWNWLKICFFFKLWTGIEQDKWTQGHRINPGKIYFKFHEAFNPALLYRTHLHERVLRDPPPPPLYFLTQAHAQLFMHFFSSPSYRFFSLLCNEGTHRCGAQVVPAAHALGQCAMLLNGQYVILHWVLE